MNLEDRDELHYGTLQEVNESQRAQSTDLKDYHMTRRDHTKPVSSGKEFGFFLIASSQTSYLPHPSSSFLVLENIIPQGKKAKMNFISLKWPDKCRSNKDNQCCNQNTTLSPTPAKELYLEGLTLLPQDRKFSAHSQVTCSSYGYRELQTVLVHKSVSNPRY